MMNEETDDWSAEHRLGVFRWPRPSSRISVRRSVAAPQRGPTVAILHPPSSIFPFTTEMQDNH
jgi:hypothetical protein